MPTNHASFHIVYCCVVLCECVCFFYYPENGHKGPCIQLVGNEIVYIELIVFQKVIDDVSFVCSNQWRWNWKIQSIRSMRECKIKSVESEREKEGEWVRGFAIQIHTKFDTKWILFVQCYRTPKHQFYQLLYFDMFVFDSSWLGLAEYAPPDLYII